MCRVNSVRSSSLMVCVELAVDPPTWIRPPPPAPPPPPPELPIAGLVDPTAAALLLPRERTWAGDVACAPAGCSRSLAMS